MNLPRASLPHRGPDAPRDEEDLADLLTAHAGALVPYLARRAGPLLLGRESPEDLAQSICREVLERGDARSFDDEDAFRRWLYATALRKVRDRYRYHRCAKRGDGREPGAATEPVAPSSTPSRDAAGREEVDRVLGALAELPSRDREVLRLARIERLPHSEIARRLGVSESHSRTLLARAVVRLTRRLASRAGAPLAVRSRSV